MMVEHDISLHKDRDETISHGRALLTDSLMTTGKEYENMLWEYM